MVVDRERTLLVLPDLSALLLQLIVQKRCLGCALSGGHRSTRGKLCRRHVKADQLAKAERSYRRLPSVGSPPRTVRTDVDAREEAAGTSSMARIAAFTSLVGRSSRTEIEVDLLRGAVGSDFREPEEVLLPPDIERLVAVGVGGCAVLAFLRRPVLGLVPARVGGCAVLAFLPRPVLGLVPARVGGCAVLAFLPRPLLGLVPARVAERRTLAFGSVLAVALDRLLRFFPDRTATKEDPRSQRTNFLPAVSSRIRHTTTDPSTAASEG
jgi:hypothetical protein